MAIPHKPGDIIADYSVLTDRLTEGAFAWSYSARRNSTNTDVFLKQYTNPTPLVPWYDGFIDHEEKMRTTLNNIGETVEIGLDFFEEGNVYYQAKEWMVGKSLADFLELAITQPETMDFDRRITNAAVFMFAMKLIHNAGIIHSDLKPANVFLIERPETKIGVSAKLIDFDFAFFNDETPPWIPDLGYVTTAGYASPEHVEIDPPTQASDVFTSCLILYELLAGLNPYGGLDEAEYKKQLLAYKCKRPAEYNLSIAPALSEIIYRGLNPDPLQRPTAEEIHKEILAVASAHWKSQSMPLRLEFKHSGGTVVTVFKSGQVGRDDFRIVGPDYKYVTSAQFEIDKDTAGGAWKIKGLEPVTNNTRLNGQIITGKIEVLAEGDKLSIGSLELTVAFVY